MSVTPTELAARLTACLAEAGRPDLRGVVKTCLICGGKRAFVAPGLSGDEDVVAKAFAVALQRPEVGRVVRRHAPRDRCNCAKTYGTEVAR